MDNFTNEELLQILKKRFEDNAKRHEGIEWKNVLKKILDNPSKMESLIEMEKTGGEVDVVKFNKETNEYIFFDCSKETPLLRRSLCYDQESLESRKSFKPIGSAVGMADKMGIKLLTEEEYKYLQSLGEFDLKTSSWLNTDKEMRKNGGAVFGDRRYGRVFIYHNGAESYYSGRGFRGSLNI